MKFSESFEFNSHILPRFISQVMEEYNEGQYSAEIERLLYFDVHFTIGFKKFNQKLNEIFPNVSKSIRICKENGEIICKLFFVNKGNTSMLIEQEDSTSFAIDLHEIDEYFANRTKVKVLESG